MRLDYGTKKENRTTVAEIAAESFADHRLTIGQDEGPVRMWYCGRKGTGMYSFRVIAAPYMLLVYGDVGDYMLQASDHDLVPWLRGAIKSEQYLISKMTNKSEVFLPKEATKLLEELHNEAESDEWREKINDAFFDWDEDYGGLDQFGQALMNIDGHGSLIHRAIDYESGVYWAVECLKKFVELLDDDHEENVGFGTCSSFFGIDTLRAAA